MGAVTQIVNCVRAFRARCARVSPPVHYTLVELSTGRAVNSALQSSVCCQLVITPRVIPSAQVFMSSNHGPNGIVDDKA